MSSHIHILGICGTFMGGIALLARELGFTVSGSDANVYPPMSTQLQDAGIELCEGYLPEHIQSLEPDCVVIGNALSRGNPAVEALLNSPTPYISGPQWLAENVLRDRWVIAVSGTHGKTTTSSMLAQILDDAGFAPGFLIGGVPGHFGVSARLGRSDFFVVEADEYDTAFFDKRSKFLHYRPRTLCINNLEFDHADIFPDLAAIQRQFHHLLRCVPGNGLVVYPADVPAVNEVLAQGLWTPAQSFGVDNPKADWNVHLDNSDGSAFTLNWQGGDYPVKVPFVGRHNVENALCAIACARHIGIDPRVSMASIHGFSGVKRRLELRGEVAGIKVYDDFAHHPTAIASTLAGLADGAEPGRVFAVIEPRSNTMRSGEHRALLTPATEKADRVFWYQGDASWSLQELLDKSPVPASVHNDLDELVHSVVTEAREGDRIVVMSNGGFGGVHQQLLDAVASKQGSTDD
ncbi:MAG: UDP-N-acetylmuramate:L-alanyl-gamma-D-glutamyl-meso-diaminopimelate ligase [Gammaproteobacteria bacterium]|nr:MAG: UDP-N-acetylmuramate:L-alanyl-gamma-D-glutamyl-meso-diaminopimelate ligase [Gammaproteobacteria bacterium]